MVVRILPTMHRSDGVFSWLGLFCVALGAAVLIALVSDIVASGWDRLSWEFLTSFPSRRPERAGIAVGLVGTFLLLLLTAILAFPIGICAAIYFEEYAGRSKFTRLLELNVANLAAIPSIIYGLLGLQVFARYLQLERSLLAGALTMSLLALPMIIISAREALDAVPSSVREAALALGATKWQSIWHHVLPLAMPGILTGCILSFSRVIGETAPVITVGALAYIAFLPTGLSSPFTVLPIQIFNWISRPQAAFHENAAAAIIVLLAVLFVFNGVAVVLRNRYQRKLSL